MSKMGRYKSYLTGVQNEGGGSRPLLDNVQKKDTFFLDVFPKQLEPFWAQIIGKVQQVIYVKEKPIWNICN